MTVQRRDTFLSLFCTLKANKLPTCHKINANFTISYFL
jgi:hypothetical protein